MTASSAAGRPRLAATACPISLCWCTRRDLLAGSPGYTTFLTRRHSGDRTLDPQPRDQGIFWGCAMFTKSYAISTARIALFAAGIRPSWAASFRTLARSILTSLDNTGTLRL